MTPDTTLTHSHTRPDIPTTPTRTPGQKALGLAIGTALGLVILAPLALSSVHLFEWSKSATGGLGLPAALAWIPILALDATALVCVGMVTYSAWRGERGGAFHVLVWALAGASAVANYRYGLGTKAPDDQWFFPIMSISGPLILDVTLAFFRRWLRIDTGQKVSAVKVRDFGLRWLPGVAARETGRAWAAGQREGILRPADAIAYVREVAALSALSGPDALRYAISALGTHDAYPARVWLAARHVTLTQSDIDAVTASLPPAPAWADPTPVTPADGMVIDVDAYHRERLAGARSKRDQIRYAMSVLGTSETSAVRAWLADRDVKVGRGEVGVVRDERGVSAPSVPVIPAQGGSVARLASVRST